MTSALAKGLMGGAVGLMGGLHQQWQQNMADQREQAYTQRLMQARALEEQRLAAIASAKDERDHEQAKELKGMEVDAANKRLDATEAGRNARSEASISAADRRAAGKGAAYKPQLFIPTSGDGAPVWVAPGEQPPEGYTVTNDPRLHKSAGSTKADPFVKLRQETAKEVGKMSPAQIAKELEARSIMPTDGTKDKRALAEALAMERNDLVGNAAPARAPAPSKPVATDQPPMPGARKAPDGQWYVQQNGQWFKVN